MLFNQRSYCSSRVREALEEDSIPSVGGPATETGEQSKDFDDASAVEDSATTADASRSASWCRHFFDTSSNPDAFVCLLPPEPARSTQAPSHKKLVSRKSQLRGMKRHLETKYHEAAMRSYKAKREDGKAVPQAAQEVIGEATKRRQKEAISFPMGK